MITLKPLPECEREDTRAGGVGAVHDLLAHVEQRFLEVEVCHDEVVNDLVLVGEDEVVEAGLDDLVRHRHHRRLHLEHRVVVGATRVPVQRDVVDQPLAPGQGLFTARPGQIGSCIKYC